MPVLTPPDLLGASPDGPCSYRAFLLFWPTCWLTGDLHQDLQAR